MRECPTCKQPVAMRGKPRKLAQYVGHENCPHPSHPAAQAVVEAVDCWFNRTELSTKPEQSIRGACRALMATLEPEEENRAE